jgi:glutamine amidotransferase
MCRHIAYLGAPLPLADLLFTPQHGLVHQSWAPRDMRGGGTINADGFGVGWYPSGSPTDARESSSTTERPSTTESPVRYRRAGPIWSDPTLPQLATSTVTGAALAAVRSATVGMPVVSTASAPFTEGPWLFSHNGTVRGWPDSVQPIAARLPIRDLLTLDAPTDAALLWALVRHRLRAGASLAAALADTAHDVLRVAPGSRLNFLLTDGKTTAATTAGHSLSVRHRTGEVCIASEPLDDDPSWWPVPDRRLVRATLSGVDITDLETS